MYWIDFNGYAYQLADPLVNSKAYLAYRKQYLLNLRDHIAEYAKQVEEALTHIEHAEARLKQVGKEKP